eukprot:634727-Pleurochrysis_carterae.AAC.2
MRAGARVFRAVRSGELFHRSRVLNWRENVAPRKIAEYPRHFASCRSLEPQSLWMQTSCTRSTVQRDCRRSSAGGRRLAMLLHSYSSHLSQHGGMHARTPPQRHRMQVALPVQEGQRMTALPGHSNVRQLGAQHQSPLPQLSPSAVLQARSQPPPSSLHPLTEQTA